MDTVMDTPRNARLAAAFMVEHVGFDREDMAKALRTDATEVSGILDERGCTRPETAKAMRGIMAIQSLLLSGYTPLGAASWFNEPSRDMGGRAPSETLVSGDPAAIATVLRSAYDRIAS